MTDNDRKDFSELFQFAFPKALPMLLGFTVLGLTYGLLMKINGYGPWWALLTSLVAYCGSMQFAAIPLMADTFNPMLVLVMSLLINFRHVFYGIPLLGKYKGAGKAKPFLIYSLADETFSVNCSTEIPPHIKPKSFYLFVSISLYLYWALMTFIGGWIGNLIQFDTRGLDFVMNAMFMVMLLQQWKKKENRIFCLVGGGFSIISLILFGRVNFVIPALVGMLLLFIAGKDRLWR